MRGLRVLSSIAAVAVLAAAGCARPPAPASAPPARAPRDPDLSVIAERYYQLIEGKHWSIADQMLAPPLRATLGEGALAARYAAFTNADVKARQLGDRVIVATLSAPAGTLSETLTFRWDGSDWQIERLATKAR